MRIKQHWFLWGFFVSVQLLQAQEKEPSIEAQQVTVVKSFNPEVIKVFKQRPKPQTYDSLAQKQQSVTFSFEDFPVVSTFTPNKATPLKLQRKQTGPLYNALGALGVGGSGQTYLNAAASVVLDRVQTFGLELLYDETSRNLAEQRLPTHRSQFSGLLTHNYTLRNSRWDTRLKFQAHQNNFYGLLDVPNVLEDALESLDPINKRTYFQLQTQWRNYDGIVNEIPLQLHLYGDSFETRETFLVFNPRFRADLGSSFVDLKLNFTGGQNSFTEDFLRATAAEYTHGVGQAALMWTRLGQRLKWQVGAKVAQYFTDDAQAESAELGIYPEFQLEIKPKKGSLRPFIKATGGEQIWSLQELSSQNPFIAPVVNILPEVQIFKAQLGFHSAIGKKIDFMWEAQYEQYDRKGFFKRLPYQQGNNLKAFEYSNAFQRVYDAFNQLSFHSTLAYSFGKDNSLQFEAVYRDPETETLEAAWNIPEIEASAKAFVRLFKKAQVQLKYTFVGNRKGASYTYFNNLNPGDNPATVVDVAAFSQVQAEVLYQLHPRWEIFSRLQLNTGDPNSRWLGFPQFQQLFLAGVQYRFNLNL